MSTWSPPWQWTTLDDHSRPYITGNGFAVRCGMISNYEASRFNPSAPGDWLFCRTDVLKQFFSKAAHHIPFRFVLFTHNSDFNIDESYRPIVEHPKVRAWFGQNIALEHPRLHPIPIGIANAGYEHGDPATFTRLRAEPIPRTELFYANYSLHTNPAERERCLRETGVPLAAAEGAGWSTFAGQYSQYTQPRPFERYLRDLRSSYFCISPRGNGLDCLRTWEALYMGAVPVVTRSRLTDAHADFPMVVLDDWSRFKSINFSPELHRDLWARFDASLLELDRYMDRLKALIPA